MESILEWTRAIFYFVIGAEMVTIGRLYLSGYKITKHKASPIIRTTWRMFFTLGIFFFCLGVMPVIKAIDKMAYLTTTKFLIVPLPFVYREIVLFRKYTLCNEE